MVVLLVVVIVIVIVVVVVGAAYWEVYPVQPEGRPVAPLLRTKTGAKHEQEIPGIGKPSLLLACGALTSQLNPPGYYQGGRPTLGTRPPWASSVAPQAYKVGRCIWFNPARRPAPQDCNVHPKGPSNLGTWRHLSRKAPPKVGPVGKPHRPRVCTSPKRNLPPIPGTPCAWTGRSAALPMLAASVLP